jgi:hypothetical protein
MCQIAHVNSVQENNLHLNWESHKASDMLCVKFIVFNVNTGSSLHRPYRYNFTLNTVTFMSDYRRGLDR